jgi:hypothetical protein
MTILLRKTTPAAAPAAPQQEGSAIGMPELQERFFRVFRAIRSHSSDWSAPGLHEMNQPVVEMNQSTHQGQRTRNREQTTEVIVHALTGTSAGVDWPASELGVRPSTPGTEARRYILKQALTGDA